MSPFRSDNTGARRNCLVIPANCLAVIALSVFSPAYSQDIGAIELPADLDFGFVPLVDTSGGSQAAVPEIEIAVPQQLAASGDPQSEVNNGVLGAATALESGDGRMLEVPEVPELVPLGDLVVDSASAVSAAQSTGGIVDGGSLDLGLATPAFDLPLLDLEPIEPPKNYGWSSFASLGGGYFWGRQEAVLVARMGVSAYLDLAPQWRFWAGVVGHHETVFGDQQDSQYLFVDLSQLGFEYRTPQLQAGIGFLQEPEDWGFGFAQSLTDIVNVKDGFLLHPEPQNVSQPQVRLSYSTGGHTLSGYYFPYARVPTLGDLDERYGLGGEIRQPWLFGVERGEDLNPLAQPESKSRIYPSFAGRYRYQGGGWQAELSAFHGLSRTPSLVPRFRPSDSKAYVQPDLPVITQLGASLAYSLQPWFVYSDTLYRLGAPNNQLEVEDYFATTLGVERQFSALLVPSDRLSLFAEYHHDGRGEQSPALLNNDAVIGAIYSTTDTAQWRAELAWVIDVVEADHALTASVGRNFGDNFSAEIFGRWWIGDFDNVPIDGLKNQSHFGTVITGEF